VFHDVVESNGPRARNSGGVNPLRSFHSPQGEVHCRRGPRGHIEERHFALDSHQQDKATTAREYEFARRKGTKYHRAHDVGFEAVGCRVRGVASRGSGGSNKDLNRSRRFNDQIPLL
jgi:hypothetical protein